MNKNQEQPLVTVIVPSYNHANYVEECLDSISNQTYKNIQWIVVDDYSKDNSVSILRNLQKKYGYELLLHDRNWGLSATLTEVISKFAKGKYIACCASDDKWMPNKLEIQVAFMENNIQYAMTYSRRYYIDKESNIIGKDDCKKYSSGDIFDKIITLDFHPAGYLIKRKIIEEMGYYPSGIIAEDFRMNCLISSKYLIGYIPEFLSYYRIEELSKKRSPEALLECHRKTIDLFKDRSIYPFAIRKHYLRCFTILARYKKSKVKSVYYMFKSLGFLNTKLFYVGIYNLIFCWR